jgi:hypothetical protein
MRKISRLQIVFIISLLVLAALFSIAVFKPFISGAAYTQVSRQSLLHNPGEWVMQFDIFNHEGRDILYTIRFQFSDHDYQEDFIVRDGGQYTYIHHIKDKDIGNGQVTYKIFKENADEPFEQATYHLQP